jgi:hypothetical protein
MEPQKETHTMALAKDKAKLAVAAVKGEETQVWRSCRTAGLHRMHTRSQRMQQAGRLLLQPSIAELLYLYTELIQ